MLKKVLIALFLVGSALFALLLYTAVDMYRIIKSGDIEREITKALVPGDGEPTEADRVLLEVIEAREQAPDARPLWGFGQGSKVRPTPSLEEAREQLQSRAGLRERLVRSVTPALEPPGTDTILMVDHSFREHRDLVDDMAEDYLSLLVAGRPGEALRLWAAMHRVARILGRGIQQQSSLIAKMICGAQQKRLDRAAGVALQRHLIPAPMLDSLEEALNEALAREVDLEPAMDAEFSMMEKTVRHLDQRLNLVQYPLRLYWGNGLEQVERARRAWDAGEEEISPAIYVHTHLAVQVMLPNFPAARRRYRENLARRQGLRAALALERARYRDGSYPDAPPPEIVDPTCGEPFRLITKGGRTILYSPGADGRDDGGDDDHDTVIWR